VGDIRTRRAESRRATSFAAATLFIGLMLSIVVASLAADGAQHRVVSRFTESSAQTAAAIESQMRSDLNELTNVGAFVVAARPSPEEFDDFVDAAHVVDHFESLTGVLVLDRVEERDKDAYLERMRETRPGFNMVSIGEHPVGTPYYVLTHYAAGSLPVKLPLGLEVSALQTVRGEIERRSSTGAPFAGAIQREPIIQDAVRDLSETEYGELFRNFEFLLAVPVFPPGHGPDDGTKATTWIAAPVGRFDDILQRSLVGQPSDVGVQLRVEISDPDLSSLGVDKAAERSNPNGTYDEAAFYHDSTFEIRGLQWSLSIWSNPDSDAPTYQLMVFALAIGSLASLVSATAVYLRIRGRAREADLRKLAAAHERAELQRDVLASVSEAVVVIDEDGRIVVGNQAWERLLTGCEPADERAGAPRHELEAEREQDPEQDPDQHPEQDPEQDPDQHPDQHPEQDPDQDRELVAVGAVADDGPHDNVGSAYVDVLTRAAGDHIVRPELELVLAGEADRSGSEISLTVEGAERRFALIVTPLHGSSRGAVLVHRDITDEYRSRVHLEQKANTDALTGLLNRAALEERARSIVSQAREAGEAVGALFIDLDGFKAINDTHGHDFGDQVLRAVAGRIVRGVRSTDLVARQGGDEFVVLVNPLADPSIAHDLASRLVASLNKPFAAHGISVPISASIGVVVLQQPLQISVGNLVRRADEAMYASKQRGGATYTVGV